MHMNTIKRNRTNTSRRTRRYPYPNEADPSYFSGRMLEALAALVSTMCTVTFFLYLITI